MRIVKMFIGLAVLSMMTGDTLQTTTELAKKESKEVKNGSQGRNGEKSYKADSIIKKEESEIMSEIYETYENDDTYEQEYEYGRDEYLCGDFESCEENSSELENEEHSGELLKDEDFEEFDTDEYSY